MPCTTGAPIWVRRAKPASRCSGLKSPDSRANSRWSVSVKVRLAMAGLEIIDGPLSTADHGGDDLPGIKVTGKPEQPLESRHFIAALADLPGRREVAVERAEIAGVEPQPPFPGRQRGIEDRLPFHRDFGGQRDKLERR